MAVKVSGVEVIDNNRNITTNIGTVDGRDIAADGAKLDTAVQPNDNVTFGTVEANAPLGAPSVKGYIGLKATTSTQTISSMTLSTTGMGDASGGTLSDGDWVLLITSWNFWGSDGGLELAVALNGTVQSATTLINTGIGETFPTIFKVKKFQVSGTPTSIEFGLNNSGTLGPPATGTNSTYESGMGLMVVFADEPSLANVTNTSLGNGATMTGQTLSSTSGAWTFSALGGFSSSTSNYTNPTATNVYNDTVATSIAGRFDVAFGYEESITTQDITGSGSTVGLVRTTFTWTQAGSPSGTAVTANGDISVTGSVDGRDIAADGAKLDGIEAGATADQTAAEIKTAYESNANTNAFTDAEQTKLAGIEAGADVTDAANVEPLVDAHLNTSSATTGQYLGWNGADYAWSTVSGYTDADVDTHLNTGTATTGEVLSWTGSDYDWVAVSVPNISITATSVAIGPSADNWNNGVTIGLSAGTSATSSGGVAIGKEAGRYAGGLRSIGIGEEALRSSIFGSSGANNTGLGYQTGYDLSTGAHNFLGGYQAGTNLTTGSYNVAIGEEALFATTTNSSNVAIGRSAGRNGNQQEAVSIGSNAGQSGGYRSVSIGYLASQYNTGSRGIAIGDSALRGVSGSSTGTNNIGIGSQAGANLTTGSDNVSIGNGALDAATTGGRNIAIGQNAMGSGVATAATGDNVAIGYLAGAAITSGEKNVAIGLEAGRDITIGTDNFLGGWLAGTNLTTGSNNVAIGNSALDATTASGQNVAIGYFAMSSGLASDANGHNVAVGSFAGLDISSGRYNFFGGYSAGANITTGTSNVAIGEGALDAATTAGQNIAIGKDAMGTGVATSASGYNIALGTSAGLDITSGTDNVLIGRSAGSNINTGERNIAIGGTANVIGTSNNTTIVIGYDASPSSATASQEITLGGSEISRFRIPGCGIDNTSAALSGITPSVDVGARDTYTLTTSGNTTFTFTGAPSSGQVGTFSLIITAGGTHTLTWPASVDWAGGTAPDAPASGEKDIYTFMTVDGGTTWYGFLAGDAMA